MRTGYGTQSGIALVVVLWVVMLLTVIVASFVFNARTHVKLTGNQAARARAEALADAGIQRGLYELFKPVADAERWKAEGQPYEFAMAGAVIRVSMVDESAYLDLNAARDELLKGLFVSVGVEEGEAQALVDAIVDWRDTDELMRLNGAERDQYLDAGRAVLPANAPFRRLEELKSVMGMTAELYQKVEGALTVYSGQSGFIPAQAPRQVLLALPGVDTEAVDAYLTARAEELAAGLVPTPFPPALAYATAGSGVYNVQSIATLDDGTRYVRQIVAKITGDPKRPIAILDWREGRP